MKVVTALVEIAIVVTKEIDGFQRQEDTEKLKTTPKKANERMDSLAKNLNEVHKIICIT